MQLFYSEHISDTEISLSANDAQHAVQTLRKKEGDVLDVTDGKGTYYRARIIQINRKKCLLHIEHKEFQKKGWDFELELALAPTKNISRTELVIEKATELGVDTISFLHTMNSERHQVKMERLERVMISAAKQSLKMHFPILKPMVAFKKYLIDKENIDAVKAFGHCREGEKEVLNEYLPKVKNKKIILMVGPEGDFSKEEVALALDNNWTPLTFGNQRLRTETASIFACSAVHLLV